MPCLSSAGPARMQPACPTRVSVAIAIRPRQGRSMPAQTADDVLRVVARQAILVPQREPASAHPRTSGVSSAAATPPTCASTER